MARDAAEPLDRIEEPRLAADREIEAAVAVRHDVEPGGFLFGDNAGNRVEVLLAEQRVAKRGSKRAAVEAAVEPQRAWVRARDGGRHDHVARDGEHGASLMRLWCGRAARYWR